MAVEKNLKKPKQKEAEHFLRLMESDHLQLRIEQLQGKLNTVQEMMNRSIALVERIKNQKGTRRKKFS
jgi:hypothetical protein